MHPAPPPPPLVRERSDEPPLQNVLSTPSYAIDSGHLLVDLSHKLTLKYICCPDLPDSPRETSITPNDDVMYVDQLLTCNTRAVPAAQAHNWTKDNSEDAGTTQSITIPSQWLGQYVTLECEAMNTIGTDSVVIFFRVARK